MLCKKIVWKLNRLWRQEKPRDFYFLDWRGSTWDHDGPAGYKPVLARWDSPGGNCRSCVSRSCLSGWVCTQTWLAGMMNNVTKLWGIHHWAMEESGRVDLLAIGYQFKEWVVCTQRVDLSHVELSGIARIQVSFCLIKSITSWGLEYLTNSRWKVSLCHFYSVCGYLLFILWDEGRDMCVFLYVDSRS